MKIGLVGFPGSGKSTVFNALTGQDVATGFAGKQGKANLGAVKVPDERVDALTEVFSPKKTTYAEVVFTDLPGGGSARGLDRNALNAMRDVDALCHVVRAFGPGPEGDAPEPHREIGDLESETILADLEIAERRVQRLQKDRSNPRELALLERLVADLEAERALRGVDLSADERKLISGYQFLSLKPLLLVLNVAEDGASSPPPEAIGTAARDRGLGIVVLSALVEQDIAQMPPEDQGEFLSALGLEQPARHRFIKAAFELLDLVSMLTAGPDECRAWPIRRNTPAPLAAGKIHSDIERGFIRVEVIRWDDLVALGTESKCREAGKLAVQGKDYIVADGDVCNFRFNV